MRASTDERTHQVYRYICKDKPYILKELMEEYNPKAFWFYIPDTRRYYKQEGVTIKPA